MFIFIEQKQKYEEKKVNIDQKQNDISIISPV